MSADQAPGRAFDAFAELKFSIAELHMLAARLGVLLGADDEATEAATWDAGSFRALDLYERTLADAGALSAKYVRLKIRERGL